MHKPISDNSPTNLNAGTTVRAKFKINAVTSTNIVYKDCFVSDDLRYYSLPSTTGFHRS